MESKWLTETEKIMKKQKREPFIRILFVIILLLGLNSIFLFAALSAPEEVRFNSLKVCIGTFIVTFIAAVIGLLIGFSINNKKPKFSDLRTTLSKSLTTQEEYTLLDTEVYGNLKREVSLGKNQFTFTPHFLIQIHNKVSYTVIKLQNVSYISHLNHPPVVMSEFYDKNNQLIGSIQNYASHVPAFDRVCAEQIPWCRIM